MVLQTYLTNLLLSYVKKYIINIETTLNLGTIFRGEMIFKNLELRLDVIQRELDIPKQFKFTKGLIGELRILIPWTNLTNKPITVTFHKIQCVLEFVSDANTKENDNKSQDSTNVQMDNNSQSNSSNSSSFSPLLKPAQGSSVDPIDNANSTAGASAASSSGGWAADLITKILANLTVEINDFQVIYLEHSADINAKLNFSKLLFYSTNSSWQSCYSELEGPWKLLHKMIEIHSAELSLCNANIISNLSINCRIQSYIAALGGVIDVNSVWEGIKPCSSAIHLDLQIHRQVNLVITQQQFSQLNHIIKSHIDLYSSAQATAAIAKSIASIPVSTLNSELKRDKTPTNNSSSTTTSNNPNTSGGNLLTVPNSNNSNTNTSSSGSTGSSSSSGWLSWLWDFVAEDDVTDDIDTEAVLEAEAIQAFLSRYSAFAPRDELSLSVSVPGLSITSIGNLLDLFNIKFHTGAIQAEFKLLMQITNSSNTTTLNTDNNNNSINNGISYTKSGIGPIVSSSVNMQSTEIGNQRNNNISRNISTSTTQSTINNNTTKPTK